MDVANHQCAQDLLPQALSTPLSRIYLNSARTTRNKSFLGIITAIREG